MLDDNSPMPAPELVAVSAKTLRAYRRLYAEVKRAYRPSVDRDGAVDWSKPKTYRESVPVALAALEVEEALG
jgi:hypothetical protein